MRKANDRFHFYCRYAFRCVFVLLKLFELVRRHDKISIQNFSQVIVKKIQFTSLIQRSTLNLPVRIRVSKRMRKKSRPLGYWPNQGLFITPCFHYFLLSFSSPIISLFSIDSAVCLRRNEGKKNKKTRNKLAECSVS